MSFRRRLSRLPPLVRRDAGASGTPSTEPPPAANQRGAETQSTVVGAQACAELTGDPLGQLGAALGRVLGNAPQTRTPGARAITIASLGFEPITTGLGHFWRHRRVLPGNVRVGAAAIAPALDASASWLSLLAVDEGIAEVDIRRALYLDTETTGLGGSGTYAFLVGIAFFEDGALVCEQLLLEGPEQEPAQLEYLSQRVAQADLLVTFNGKSFDWPLLKGRCVMNRQPQLACGAHLDLLHLARRVHKFRLTRCTLKTVESQVLGFERIGDISGEEVAQRYSQYLRVGDPELLRQVVEHNWWDVLTMPALLGLYGTPSANLRAEDFSGIAALLRRVKALEPALTAAGRAVDGGDAARGQTIRAEIHRVLGDQLASLVDLENAVCLPDCPQGARLALAKLYEHFLKQPQRALDLVAQGTGEPTAALGKRRERLVRKLTKTKRALHT